MLGSIVMAADLLETSITMDKEEESIEMLDLIRIASRKTLSVTNELLLLASVRQQDVKTEMLDMCKIVDEAIARNYNLVLERKAILKKPEHCLSSRGYAPWVEEVWANYISNAIKYGGVPPIIEFGSEEIENKAVRYWIKDNGKGIAPEKQNLLFNKFSRLDEIKVEGHGLGLSIVRRIIEKLGGQVGVESTGIDGQGAIFYFTLPGV